MVTGINYKNRNASLDLARLSALFCVVSVHFFLYTGFYVEPCTGWRMYLLTLARCSFMVCIPLFLLLTGYLLSYPTGYSILDVTEDALRFTPARIDVDGWAAETGVHYAVLRNFSAWQKESFHSYCADAVNSMAKRNPLREDEARDAADFFYTVMTAYWDGTLDARREVLQTMPGCRPFFRCAEGYSYGWWLRDLMESANPLMRGFTLDR